MRATYAVEGNLWKVIKDLHFFNTFLNFFNWRYTSINITYICYRLYLRLLLFLPAILIPACDSSSPAFHMMFSTHKLSKRVTVYRLDVLLSQFGTSQLFQVRFCWVLTCIQVSQETGKVVWYPHLFQNFLCRWYHSNGRKWKGTKEPLDEG